MATRKKAANKKKASRKSRKQEDPRPWIHEAVHRFANLAPAFREGMLTQQYAVLLARALISPAPGTSVALALSPFEVEAVRHFAYWYLTGCERSVSGCLAVVEISFSEHYDKQAFPFSVAKLEEFVARWWQECPNILIATRYSKDQVLALLEGTLKAAKP